MDEKQTGIAKRVGWYKQKLGFLEPIQLLVGTTTYIKGCTYVSKWLLPYPNSQPLSPPIKILPIGLRSLKLEKQKKKQINQGQRREKKPEDDGCSVVKREEVVIPRRRRRRRGCEIVGLYMPPSSTRSRFLISPWFPKRHLFRPRAFWLLRIMYRLVLSYSWKSTWIIGEPLSLYENCIKNKMVFFFSGFGFEEEEKRMSDDVGDWLAFTWVFFFDG